MTKRVAGRKLWFTVHKWVGLLLFLLLVPLSASGSLLVWQDWTDGFANPQRYRVSDDPALLPPSAYVSAARSVLAPGDRIASVELPAGPGRPVVVTASTGEAGRRPGPPPRHQVWLDPATAAVVDHGDPAGGMLRTLHVFHGSLMMPGIGRKIVGWLGWAMLASCLTGIWLWWPTVGRAVRGFRWRRGPLVSGNLHHQVGIWIAAPLAVLSFTGAYISFPEFFRGIERTVAREEPPSSLPVNRRARPVAQPRLAIDQAFARAGIERGSGATIRYPLESVPKWTVLTDGDGYDIDDATGAVAPAENAPGAARFMRQLHDGHAYNAGWQAIIFSAGLAPAALGVTGVIMWLRTRGWRRRLASRPATA